MTALHAARMAGITLLLVAAPVMSAGGRQFIATGHETLRGLPGVELFVEELQPELERGGLTGASLKADVETWIRAGGIVVFPSQTDNPSPAKPYLYLDLNALTLPGGDIALAVQLHLRQTLRSPVTGSNVVNAMTWDSHSVISVPAANLQAARPAVRAHVDRFIEDWQAVHK